MLFDIRSLPGALVHNECVMGMHCRDALQLEEEGLGLTWLIQEDKYDVVVICLGTNDLGNGRTVEELQLDLAQLAKCAIAASSPPSPASPTFLASQESVDSPVSMNPMIIFLALPFATQDINERLCEGLPLGVHHIPFMPFNHKDLLPDGIHLNPQGRRRMTLHLQEHIKELNHQARDPHTPT